MNRNHELSSLLIGLLMILAIAGSAFAQEEKLGDIKYVAPIGWTKSAKDHAVVFNSIDQANGKFAFITLYAAGASDGSPRSDFASAWKTRVVEPWKGDANPKTVTETSDGWTLIAGGTQIDFQGMPAFAFLNVASGFGKSVVVLGILNDNSYLTPFQEFVERLDIDKSVSSAAVVSSPGTLQYDSYGHLIIPLPTWQLTTSDLAGQWGEAASFHQRYVYRSSGAYAGADSLTFKSKMTLTANGGFYNDFYAIQNGKLIKEKTGGVFSVNGRILSINEGNPKRFVIRGWLEMSDMTVLEVNGPYYKDEAIPAEILTNPAQGANLNQQWVRKK